MDDIVAELRQHPDVLRLETKVQHYDWGDTRFIPTLLGIDNAEARPYAELWMGAHRDLPAVARFSSGATLPLDELVARASKEILGASVAAAFEGELPYLLKVLAAREPLSIQAHPGAARAREGYARETAAGIPLTAAHRSYKDQRHKPELVAALTDFYALRGFRPLREIRGIAEIPGAENVDSWEDLRELYRRLMTATQREVETILTPVLERAAAENEKCPFQKTDREYWLLRADRQFGGGAARDRGLFSIHLLNLIRLGPGESLFLPAGVLHAYLEGVGIEIMASSNNVLRGGLTTKHVDVPELLDNVIFRGGRPEILLPQATADARELVYPTPATEFELRRLDLGSDDIYERGGTRGAEISLVTSAPSPESPDGLVIETPQSRSCLARGDVFLAPDGVPYRIESRGEAQLFRAVVPDGNATSASE